ncbi:MAG: PcrA [Parcubacteria group bacterium Gr01-1014_44]|nr:MAG: PcrA [Parcubacteria group bacterium Gr01-1014_44]
MSKLFEGLNEKQMEGVRATEGPVLIIAAAGSGKTKVLTHRIAHLIEKGVSPEEILAVTFTNKAAGEMKERISSLLKKREGVMPLVGTFHSVGARFLREERGDFTIYDSDEQLDLVKNALAELEIDSKKFNPRAILGRISQAKTDLAGPDEYADSAKEFFEKVVAKVYPLYQKKLQTGHALDFDDLIFLTVKMFQEKKDILEKYQNRFKYLLVDEYQDTNRSQYLFLKLLAQKNKNIMAVGDDYQSIYMFRQADIRNILSFEKDYPQAKIIFLEQNYRSTQNILAVAQNIISNNKFQRHKNLWTENQTGEKIFLAELEHERAEGDFIAQKTREETRAGRGLNELCVLYRIHAQSRAVEEALLKNGIPYKIIGGLKFYDRKEIKDILAYLKLLRNPADFLSLERIANIPTRGIGKITFGRLRQKHQESGENLAGILKKEMEENTRSSGHSTGPQSDRALTRTQQKALVGLTSLSALLTNLAGHGANDSLSKMIKKLLNEIEYQKYLQEKTTEHEARWENVKELLTVTKKYDHLKAGEALPSFLEEVALLQMTDEINPARLAEAGSGVAWEEKKITLMTLHASKGLEFPVVFMVGMEEGIFPNPRAIGSQAELEEERRLCYVGITRAKEKLFLTHCRSRTMYGSWKANPPSRFIKEIPGDYVEKIGSNSPRRDFNYEDFIDYD